MDEECSKDVHLQMKLNYTETEKCVNESFTDPSNFLTSEDNKYLLEDFIYR